MGSACCVAAKDRTITDRIGSEVMTRNDRYSPSWSFRWDNRRRVAGEESSVNCFSDSAGMNDRLDNKSHTTVETGHATEGSPLESSRSLTWHKSSLSEENGVPQSDRSGSEVMTRNDRYSPSWSFRWDNRRRVAGEESSVNCFSDSASMNDRLDNKSHTTVETANATEGSPLESSRSLTWHKSSLSEENGVPRSDPVHFKNLREGKESRGTTVSLELSPTKMSTSAHSVSSFSASPLSSSRSQLMPLSSLTPSRWPRRSPGHHLLRQVSDSRIRGMMSPNFSISEEGSPYMYPGWSNKSNTNSHGGSSDGWSNRDRWSFDSESLSFSRDRVSRSSGRVSSSPAIEIQTCGVCSKLLTERSSWSSQKIVATNGLPAVAVLICGHVYHAECLENMTPEINKYDPACPICTLGAKKVLKLSEKAMGELDLKRKFGKKLRSRVVDGGDSVLYDRFTSGRGPRMGSSSSMKTSTSTAKPFLRRHFSFGYKPNKSLPDNSSKKKRFFWSKSSKE